MAQFGGSDQDRIQKMRDRKRWLWLPVLCSLSLLGFMAYRCTNLALDQDLRVVLKELPSIPDAQLLSEVWSTTGGSDERCDGRIVSRLYGTQQPIEPIVRFLEGQLLAQKGWANARRIRQSTEPQTAYLVNEAGYRLVAEQIENIDVSRQDPFFLHRGVVIGQQYKTLFQIKLVHIRARYVDHCWEDVW